jgi:hypothetical protein
MFGTEHYRPVWQRPRLVRTHADSHADGAMASMAESPDGHDLPKRNQANGARVIHPV